MISKTGFKTMTVRLVAVSIAMAFLTVPSAIAADLRIATGGPNGTYHAFGEDIKRICIEKGLSIEVLETQGSLHNYEVLNSDQAELAIMQSDAMEFIKAKDSHAPLKLRVLMPLFKEELHILSGKNIQSVSDLMRKQFAMGKFGSGTYVTANQVLSANYIGNIEKLFDLTSEEAIKLVLTNKIDAMALVSGKPTPLFKKLEGIADDPGMGKLLKQLHFVPVTNKKLFEKYYVESKIDAEDYTWVDETTPTIAVQAILVHYDEEGHLSKSENKKDSKIATLFESVKSHINELKKNGHPKWNEVDLSHTEVKGWKTDPMVQSQVDIKKLDSLFK